jgi:hypothetical protein
MGAHEARLILYAKACRERAARTASPLLRERLLAIADQYKREVELLTEARRSISESMRVIREANDLVKAGVGIDRTWVNAIRFASR